MIIFVSPTEFNQPKLEELSRRIWDDLGVLHVLYRRLCSSDKYNYIFNPFIKTNNDFGQLRNFSVMNNTVDINSYINLLRNLNGYPVNVSLFVRKPTAVRPVPRTIKEDVRYQVLERSEGFGGVDGMVLASMSEYLNFFPVINIPPADIEYGYVLPNGTSYGSIGDVISRRVAISFNDRFLVNYGTDDIEFSTPVGNDMICLVVPSAQKIPQWLKIFRCFTIDAWVGIFGMYLLVTLFWYTLKSKSAPKKITFIPALETYSIFIAQSLSLPKLDSHRVFFAGCMLFNIILTGTFQSSLVTSFTTDTYYRNIKTLQEFDESGLKIGTTSVSLAEIFGSDGNPLYKTLRNKIILINGSSMDRAALKRDIAAIERNADAKMRIKTDYTSHDGFEMLHILRECPRSYHMSYIVSKGSPYLRVFNHVIVRFKEAGLIKKWSVDTVDAYITESRRGRESGSGKMKVFTLYDIQTAFYLLIIGLLMSSVVFLVEICLKKRKIKCK